MLPKTSNIYKPVYLKFIFVFIITFISSVLSYAESQTVNLKPFWDKTRPLENPHKGWYHHYLDNGLRKYLAENDAELENFPGMDHLYLRLAWSYLEPEEGVFQWNVIDSLIEKWTAKGKKISFRISCRETGTSPIEQQFATPKWVIEAGAKGDFWKRGAKPGNPNYPWEPIYDDPVFMRKLENFIQAFAARYDGKPWLRYVDVGSIGDWGEGHTTSGSNRVYGWQARLKHLEIHRKYFRKTLIVVTDDFVYAAPTQAGRDKLHRYIVENGMTYRDDSILVDWYVGQTKYPFSIRSPEMFEAVYKTHPTVLELQHYGTAKKTGNWKGTPDSTIFKIQHSNGPEFLRGAIKTMHATYIGYHGYAREWLADNPKLTLELLNLCGYWYLPHSVTLPDKIKVGKTGEMQIAWQNIGVAPAYNPYDLQIQLQGPETIILNMDAKNMQWIPDTKVPTPTKYPLHIPLSLKPGAYSVSFLLYSPSEGEVVDVALKKNRQIENNFFAIGEIKVIP